MPRLQRIADAPGPTLAIAEAALALAQLDRPGLDLGPARRTLATVTADVAAGADGPSLDRARTLADAIHGRHGFAGDSDTYDDLRNTDFAEVLARRRGLPVAVALVYLHAARDRGWTAFGLNTPGHFLIMIDGAPGPLPIDPFHGGRVPAESDLRQLLAGTGVGEAEPTDRYLQPIPDRMVLVRLINNRKLRLLRAGNSAAALDQLDRMLLFAPEESGLWAEAAELAAAASRIDRALDAIQRHRTMAAPAGERRAVEALHAKLRGRMH